MTTSLLKPDLVVLVESIRRQSCCYAGDPCDCKYGNMEWTDRIQQGEQTSCPELRELVHLLAVMTQDEYYEIMARPPVKVPIAKKPKAVKANSRKGLKVTKIPAVN